MKAKHPILKRGLHWGGSALAIIGIVFVALRLRNYSAEIDFSRFDVAAWIVIVGLAIIYGLSNLMLASAWRDLLQQFGASASRRWAIRIYGISQIARYVPGNIFHIAGRQAMGMSAGVPSWPLVKSAVWELGLISASGGLFGLLALPLIVPGLPVVISAMGFVAVMGITAGLLWRFLSLPVTRAFGWYAGFLAISGLLFVGVIELLVENPVNGGLSWLPFLGAYVLAWLAGLVTPGAPAGLGVRELVLLFLLNGVVGEADLLLAVVLGRLVTVVGDFLFFLISFVTPDKHSALEKKHG